MQHILVITQENCMNIHPEYDSRCMLYTCYTLLKKYCFEMYESCFKDTFSFLLSLLTAQHLHIG